MKKLLKFLTFFFPVTIVIIFLMFMPAFLFAQDTASQDTTSIIPGFHPSANLKLIIAIVLVVYEGIARKIPTLKNYSIIGVIILILQKIFPNNSTTATKLP